MSVHTYSSRAYIYICIPHARRAPFRIISNCLLAMCLSFCLLKMLLVLFPLSSCPNNSPLAHNGLDDCYLDLVRNAALVCMCNNFALIGVRFGLQMHWQCLSDRQAWQLLRKSETLIEKLLYITQRKTKKRKTTTPLFCRYLQWYFIHIFSRLDHSIQFNSIQFTT